MRHPVEEIVEVTGWTGGVRQGREWADVERDIGTTLPADYKELFSRFPSGAFRDLIVVTNPVDARTDYPRFIGEEVFGILEILADEELEYLENADYRLFPDQSGLLPWGHDGQGGMLCWITEPADPDRWRVAYYAQGMDHWREHPGPMTEVIREVLTSAGDDNIFGWTLGELPRVFRVPSIHLGDGRWLPSPEYR
ncbi:SMI1/KNR4 family protein [Amycolatopsis sp. WGS_07]|uniref:SMI1/KNR4 family protein n=1 Tax=Amycolatopsis sp. WGS_07 TaxID=3076764 RepID=UPI0038738451